MITQCYFCGGTPVPKAVTAENWWGEALVLVEGVPALVCDTCGETYFDAETSRQLDELRRSPPPQRRVVEVPVYEFSTSR